MLIGRLLDLDASTRFNAEKAMGDPWVKHKAPNAVRKPVERSIIDNLRSFRSKNKFKKAALHVIANQLDEGKIKDLKSVFMSLDVDHDGRLTNSELKQGL